MKEYNELAGSQEQVKCKICGNKYPAEEMNREATSARRWICDACLASVEVETGKEIATD